MPVDGRQGGKGMLFMFVAHVEPCRVEAMIFWSRHNKAELRINTPKQTQFDTKTSVYQIKGERETQWLDGLNKPLLH